MKSTSPIRVRHQSRGLPALLAVAFALGGVWSGGCGGGGTQSQDGASNADGMKGSGGRAGSGGTTGTGGEGTPSGGAPGTGGATTGTGGATTGTGGTTTGTGGTTTGTGGGATGSGGRGTGGATGSGGVGGTGSGGTGTMTGGATGSGGRGIGAGTNSGGAGGVSSGGRGGATVGSGGAGTSSGGAGGAGCTSTAGCSSTQFCDFGNNMCGMVNVVTGTCKTRPQGCTANVAPACACDHQVYSNSCLANTAGQDASDGGGCTAPTGTFPCGSAFCNKTTAYCSGTIGGTLGVTTPGQYVCTAFPAACAATPTCACLKAANCTMSADGDVRVMILAP